MREVSLGLDIYIEDKRWRHIPRLRVQLKKAASATLIRLPKHLRFPCMVNVLLTNNEGVRCLNRDFRGIDKPTNVLSFPQFYLSELPKKGKKRERIELGDIAFGYQYVVAEAKKDNKILINHVHHLLIHGILHLFGYDHRLARDAIRMERLEVRIMKGLGLPNPYRTQPKEPKAR